MRLCGGMLGQAEPRGWPRERVVGRPHSLSCWALVELLPVRQLRGECQIQIAKKKKKNKKKEQKRESKDKSDGCNLALELGEESQGGAIVTLG